MATNRNQITFGVEVEKLEVFGEGSAECFHSLLVQAGIVRGLPEFLGFVLENHFDLLAGRHYSKFEVTFEQGTLSSNTLVYIIIIY